MRKTIDRVCLHTHTHTHTSNLNNRGVEDAAHCKGGVA